MYYILLCCFIKFYSFWRVTKKCHDSFSIHDWPDRDFPIYYGFVVFMSMITSKSNLSSFVFFLFAEVVKRKSQGQAQQPGFVWQADVWEADKGGALLQADHSLSCEWKAQGQGISCEKGARRALTKRWVLKYGNNYTETLFIQYLITQNLNSSHWQPEKMVT